MPFMIRPLVHQNLMMAALSMKGFVLNLFGQRQLKKNFFYGGLYELPEIQHRLTCKKCG